MEKWEGPGAPIPEWLAISRQAEAEIMAEYGGEVGRWLTAFLAGAGIVGAINEGTPYASIVLVLIIALNLSSVFEQRWRLRRARRIGLFRPD